MKFWTKYLSKLIKKHTAFSITFLILIISSVMVGRFDDNIYKRIVVHSGTYKVGDNTKYFYLYQNGNDVKSIILDQKLKLQNGYYIEKETNGFNVIFAISLFISILIMSVGIFSDDGIKFRETYYDLYVDEVECILYGDRNYYRIDGRLLASCIHYDRIHTRLIRENLVDYLKNKNLFPIWKTPQEERLEKLKKVEDCEN